MPCQCWRTLYFLTFLSCKSWFIFLFIVEIDVFKEFAVDFCVSGFALIISIFTLERFETVRTVFRYSFGVTLHL